MSETRETVIAGRFEVRKAHSGGMGVVYAVRDRESGRMYAAKTVRRDLRSDSRIRQRFDREVQTWIRLGQHPNLVSALFVEEDEGTPYLFLEYMEGPTLAALLREDRPLNLLQAVDLAGQFARGLAFAHEKPMGKGEPGIVHRDVKPENLFLTLERVGKVSDLGIAKVLSVDLAATAEGIGVGTPLYISPEQLKGSAGIDGRADVYSFGAVLYEMLTGEVPLRADTLESQIYLVLRKDPAPPEALNAKIPPELSDLVLACLSKNPDDRPAGFRPILDRLRGLLAAGRLFDRDPPASTCPRCGYASARRPGACPVCDEEMGPPAPFEGHLAAEARPAGPVPARLTIADRSVSRSVVRVGDPIEIVVSVVNGGTEPARGVEFPYLVPDRDVFRLESSKEMWRGEILPTGSGRGVDLAYSVVPLREGSFRLPPAEIRYLAASEGQKATTGGKALKIAVHPNYHLPLSGREKEWKALQRHLGREETAFALVTSEPGGGRSRFVDDFGDWLRGQGRLVLKGKALERGGEPLKLFHDIARRIFLADSEPLSAQGLMARVIDRLAPLVGEDPALAGFFTSILRGVDHRESQARLRGYLWFRLLAALARERPVVLLLTDIQWGDEESVDLMETLTLRAREEGLPLSVIASSLSAHPAERARRRIAYLNERYASLASNPGLARRVVLPPLGPDAVKDMLGRLFPGSTLDEDHPWLIPTLTDLSGGNAFLLMQILRLLREARDEDGEPLVSAEGGDWTIRSALTEESLLEMIPQEMDGVVRAMVFGLPEDVRRVLDYAAVVGGEFDARLLEILVPDRSLLDAGLEALEEAEVIRARDSLGERFRFINSVVPAIVLRTVAERSRRSLARLHREVAHALETLLGESGLRRVALTYARHLLFAGRKEDSFRWHVTAGEGYVRQQLFLRARTALNGASRLIDEGVTPPAGALGTYHYLRGEVCRVTGDLSGALAAFDAAIHHLDGERERGLLAQGLSRMGRIHESRGEPDRAVHCHELAAQVRVEIGDRFDIAHSLNDLGSVHLLKGEDRRAHEKFLEARTLAEETGNEAALARALDSLAAIAIRRDDWEDAESLYGESYALGEGANDRIGMAHSLNGLGGLAVRRGDLDRGAKLYREAFRLRREVGDREGMASVLSNLGVIHDRRGEYEEALRYYRRGAEAHREMGSRGGLATVLNNIGVVNLTRGDIGLAVEHFSEALRIRREIGDGARTGTALTNLAEARVLAGQWDAAECELEEAESLLSAVGHDSGRARALVTQAALRRRRGDPAGAEEFLAAAHVQGGRDPSVRSEIHLETAEQHLERGEAEAADRAAERGRVLALEAGDREGCARALRVLSGAKAALGEADAALDLLSKAEENLEGTSGPELARALLARGRLLARDDSGRAREVLMRARGLLDAMEARGAVLSERAEVARCLKDELRVN